MVILDSLVVCRYKLILSDVTGRCSVVYGDYLQKKSCFSTHVLISEVTEIARRADDGELLEGRTEKQEICRRWNNE